MGSFITIIIILLIIFKIVRKTKPSEKPSNRKQRPYQPYGNGGAAAYMPNRQWTNPAGGIPAHMRGSMQKTVVNQQTRPKQAVPQQTSGNVILDRVLREEAGQEIKPEEDAWQEGDVVNLDTIGLGMPTGELSPYMKEVQGLIVTGYTVQMPGQRDFLMEGLKLLDQHVS